MFESNLTSRWVRPKRNYVPFGVSNPDKELWMDTAKELLGERFLGLVLCPMNDVDSTGGSNLNSTIFKIEVVRTTNPSLYAKGEFVYVNNRLLESTGPILQWLLDTIKGGMEIY